jgi:hypothetical protein
MARIRTIKPEFPHSEKIGGLSRDARLLFLQLFTVADDAGRLRGASRMLASLLYPYDDDAPKLIGKWLTELDEKGCIRRYEVDGSQYVEIVNWLKHQKIDRPSESRIPAFEEASPKPRECSRASDADLVSSTLDHVSPRASRLDEQFEEFQKAYPKRKGGNPWEPARKLFYAAVKQGVDPDKIIAAVKFGVGFDRDKIGTEFIPQAVKWLRDRRWEDYTDAPDVPSGFVISLKTPEQARVWLEAKAAAGEDITFFRSQLERGGSITVPSEYPPGYEHRLVQATA